MSRHRRYNRDPKMRHDLFQPDIPLPRKPPSNLAQRLQNELAGRRLTHRELMKGILIQARWLGVDAYSVPDSRNCTCAGFPDLVLRGAAVGAVLFREVKLGDDPLDFPQQRWRASLTAAGCDYAVWTDDDWRSGLIDQELHRLAGINPASQ